MYTLTAVALQQQASAPQCALFMAARPSRQDRAAYLSTTAMQHGWVTSPAAAQPLSPVPAT